MNPDDITWEELPEREVEISGNESIYLVREVLSSNGDATYYIKSSLGDGCTLIFSQANVETSCDTRGKKCKHILPALNLGIGRDHIGGIIEGDNPKTFALPVYFEGDLLITTEVTVSPRSLPAGKFGEVSVSTPIDGIGKHTQSHRSIGTIKHSIGMVGHEDTYLSIKTMVSSWCQSLCNDLLTKEFRPGEDQYKMCKSAKHQPSRSKAYTQPTVMQLSTLCITGLCPKCFMQARVAEIDVPVPF